MIIEVVFSLKIHHSTERLQPTMCFDRQLKVNIKNNRILSIRLPKSYNVQFRMVFANRRELNFHNNSAVTSLTAAQLGNVEVWHFDCKMT